MKTKYLITLLTLMLVVGLIYGGVRIGAISWPYARIKNYEEYYRLGGEEEYSGTDRIDISPSKTAKYFPIIPGILHGMRSRVTGGLVVYERHFRRDDGGSSLQVDSLVVQHSKGEDEVLIAPSETETNHIFILNEPWTIIAEFTPQQDDIVVCLSGLYTCQGEPPVSFTVRQPWYYARATKTEKESWYRGP